MTSTDCSLQSHVTQYPGHFWGSFYQIKLYWLELQTKTLGSKALTQEHFRLRNGDGCKDGPAILSLVLLRSESLWLVWASSGSLACPVGTQWEVSSFPTPPAGTRFDAPCLHIPTATFPKKRGSLTILSLLQSLLSVLQVRVHCCMDFSCTLFLYKFSTVFCLHVFFPTRL